MRAFLSMLVVVSAFSFISSATVVDIFEVIEPAVVRPRAQKEQQSTPKSDDGKRRKRFISRIDEANIINTINSLRSSVGASNMNYLFYNSSLEDDATNWTRYCNYDAQLYASTDSFFLKRYSSTQPDHSSVLEAIFDNSNNYNLLSSVYLQYVGADNRLCSTILANGQYYTQIYLTAYVFSYTSNFDFYENQRQYDVGEQCTTCQSGSYWCYQDLCRDDCSNSKSNCYCNSYCLNCASTNGTTCTCQCLQGWTGSRCENSSGINATEPICSTTPRMSSTKRTTTTTTTTTTLAARNRNSGSIRNPSAIGITLVQLVLYATMTLFLKS